MTVLSGWAVLLCSAVLSYCAVLLCCALLSGCAVPSYCAQTLLPCNAVHTLLLQYPLSHCALAGGYTWAELWHLADRQPEIQQYVAECAHALTSDPTTGTMWWAHPGGGLDGHDRYNGTLQRSDNGGATWQFAAHITTGALPAGGYGYSDIHLLPDGTVSVVYQRTFNPYDHGIEGGGYDLAVASITLSD